MISHPAGEILGDGGAVTTQGGVNTGRGLVVHVRACAGAGTSLAPCVDVCKRTSCLD